MNAYMGYRFSCATTLRRHKNRTGNASKLKEAVTKLLFPGLRQSDGLGMEKRLTITPCSAVLRDAADDCTASCRPTSPSTALRPLD